jgi:hypothetical protein
MARDFGYFFRKHCSPSDSAEWAGLALNVLFLNILWFFNNVSRRNNPLKSAYEFANGLLGGGSQTCH